MDPVYVVVGIAIIGAAVGFPWLTYNTLVKLDVRVEEAWSGITVQLKRRVDLIPNVVEVVKGYAAHENRVFEEVTQARSNVISSTRTGPKAAAIAENQLEGALKTLFAVSEAYPELQAADNFRELQDELIDTENKIQAARRYYNIAVKDLSTKIRMFPSNMIAVAFDFKKKEFFTVDDVDSLNVPVVATFSG